MAKAREISGLNCDASASEGMRLVLRTRMEELSDFHESSPDWTGVEGVHDMRVASRRLRSVLRDFKPYLRREGLPQKELRALADRLGAVRDLDVLIAALDNLKTEAPEEVVRGIEHLLAEHRRRRERVKARLENESFESLVTDLCEQFKLWLERAVRAPQTRKRDLYRSEEKSFRQVGGEIILARYRDLLDQGRSLYKPFEVEEIHDLRIAAKRLRYALELFAACREQFIPFAEETAELQKALGELHDCDVWIEDLGERLTRRQRKGIEDDDKTAETIEAERNACVWLLRHFMKERTKYYREALERWHEWETTRFFADLIAALEPPARPQAASAAQPAGEEKQPSQETQAEEAEEAETEEAEEGEGEQASDEREDEREDEPEAAQPFSWAASDDESDEEEETVP